MAATIRDDPLQVWSEVCGRRSAARAAQSSTEYVVAIGSLTAEVSGTRAAEEVRSKELQKAGVCRRPAK